MQNEDILGLFYIPKEEHPFECALIGSGRLLCTLRVETYEHLMLKYGYFLEVDIAGHVRRTTVEWDSYFREKHQYVYSPEQGSDFPIYGLHEAGQLYVKYLPRMLAGTF